jgi:FtsZ-binding cell division protein ZapB
MSFIFNTIKYFKNIILISSKMNDTKEILKSEIEELKKKNNELEEKLKNYTNPIRNKKYYENNSEIVKEKAKNYMEKIKETNPEKLKKWRHQAYLNQKAKINISHQIQEN